AATSSLRRSKAPPRRRRLYSASGLGWRKAFSRRRPKDRIAASLQSRRHRFREWSAQPVRQGSAIDGTSECAERSASIRSTAQCDHLMLARPALGISLGTDRAHWSTFIIEIRRSVMKRERSRVALQTSVGPTPISPPVVSLNDFERLPVAL